MALKESRIYRFLSFFSRQNEFSLLVAIGTNNSADGQLFWDDGESRKYMHIANRIARINPRYMADFLLCARNIHLFVLCRQTTTATKFYMPYFHLLCNTSNSV